MNAKELFSIVLHREPTEWEAEYWNNELSHHPLDVVIRRLAASDETERFRHRTTFSASELFPIVLHRAPTEWEVQYWDNELSHHPLEAVIKRLSASDELKRLQDDKTFSASELFSALLHREPNEWEAQYWEGEISGNSLARVIRKMTESPEHRRFLDDARQMFVPAGHFYSPIVNQEFVRARRDSLYQEDFSHSGISFCDDLQISFLKDIESTASSLPFTAERTEGLRYHYENNAFLYGDAIVYATMLQKYRPRKIVEVGSGFSSALALDVCDITPGFAPQIRFIDPYPQLARDLIGDRGRDSISVEEAFIQDVDPSSFDDLDSGDFYFLDTTHVVKTGSDVLYHFEKVLPRLKSGTIIHVHDIFFPFEYPEDWVFNVKLSWNELYYVRAFLTDNPKFEILFFNDYMKHKHPDRFFAASPLFKKNAGCSLWLRKR